MDVDVAEWILNQYYTNTANKSAIRLSAKVIYDCIDKEKNLKDRGNHMIMLIFIPLNKFKLKSWRYTEQPELGNLLMMMQ